MKLNKAHLLALPLVMGAIAYGCAKAQDPVVAKQAPQVCTTGSVAFKGSTFSSVGSEAAGDNVMSVTVGGACSGYNNEPCVSVTICSPSNPSQCQTINNILLDTGSFGLRIFNSLITVPLTPINSGNSSLAECVQFGGGNSQWGQVKYAYVQLGSEPKVAVPILAIDPNYNVPPPACSSDQSVQDVSPAESGYNGILGVGLFAQDCGDNCVTDSGNGQYFACTGNNCACGATADLTAQVRNPVDALPTDNNGVMLSLPAVGAGGAASVSGSLYLGIATQANNAVPNGVVAYEADGYGEFLTKFAGYSSTKLSAFIDSGSNALYFPPPTNGALTACPSSYGSDFYCPGSTQSLSAVIYGSGGSPNSTINFSVANASTLPTSNFAFSNLAGTSVSGSTVYFDWGLPFFFGRNVYVGIAGKTSSLNNSGNPYWGL